MGEKLRNENLAIARGSESETITLRLIVFLGKSLLNSPGKCRDILPAPALIAYRKWFGCRGQMTVSGEMKMSNDLTWPTYLGAREATFLRNVE